jgi:hypothetical protein
MNQQFFEKVLPTQGNICVAGITTDGKIQPFLTADFDVALSQLESFARKGVNVYFTPATYEGMRRKAYESVYVKSFFLDLDCLHGKEDQRYDSKEEALTALQDFCAAIDWPMPVLIDSGGGVHAYWIFDEEVPAGIWKKYARAFKQTCMSKGLKIDEGVPADAARLMRVPGSVNFRYDPPTESKLLTEVYTYPFESLIENLDPIEEPFDLTKVEKGMDEDTKALFDKKNGNYEYVFSKLAVDSLEGNGCAQIKQIIEQAATCPEPLWYAGLSVAARCVDGADAIHRISEDYPMYSYADTERKAAQSLREASWAHGCDAFARENASACEGCPHRARIGKAGPIMLARVIKLAVEPVQPPAGEAAEEADQAQSVREEADPKNLLVFPDFLQPFFRPINGGVWFQPPPRITKDGKKIPTDPEMLISTDLYPTQRLFSPHDGECLLMRLVLPHDATREFLMPLREVTSPERMKAVLAANSVAFEPAYAPKIASYLMKWASYLIQTRRANIMRIQQGWTEDHESFVLGATEYTATEKRHCPPSPAARNIVKYVKESGTLEGWQAAAKLFNDPGYEMHAFTMLCGFATPLIEFTNVNGVVLSLYGGSGTGKTGALYGAMSIWGQPEGLTINDATPNALNQRMVSSKNITFGLDEQTNLEGKVASDVAYKTSSGRPKLRMRASSNEEREMEFVTRLISIMTTNTSLIDIISTYKNNTSAEEMRILEPTVTAPSSGEYALTSERGIAMFDAFNKHYGHAGPVYVQHLMKLGASELRHQIQNEYLKVGQEFTNSGEYRFIANLIATVRAASRYIRDAGLVDFDIDRIIKVVGELFTDIIYKKRRADANTREDVLGDFINKNIQNMLVLRDGKVTIAPRGPLYVRAEVDDNTIFVSSSAIKTFLHETRLGVKEFESRLTKAGILKGKVRKQMASGWNDAVGSTNVQAYVFETDISNLFKEVNNGEAATTGPAA